MTEVFTATNCYQCRFFHGEKGIVCAVHPSGSSSEFCLDFEPITLTNNHGGINEFYSFDQAK